MEVFLMQKNTNEQLRLIRSDDERVMQATELKNLLLHKSKFVLPVVCPSCGNVVGYLNSSTGYYVIQGSYCVQCGKQVKAVAEK